ncbi:DsbA family oxidoreductase [Pararhodobacter zhoushanensis]|uniref:DsbA family oxidoreductase n=1 Tax=Pararhodobacter zhoushanensis TaxID=2479545 RepID=A0ABT3H0H0_9RHOB|nr:DsbA family oxidoreductase [Pararhodobacter zhoushanensis]MCW1933292.1 DsbA family oxidoreductase [Pararhodobacter zhoushanensis]
MSTKLDIFSDPVCPWCYIGKARLERALEQRPDHPLIIEWHPFMLNPTMPPEGMDRREYLQAKFGPPDEVVRVHLPIVQACEELGLPLELEKMERNPSTLNAQRLIHWAGLEGHQNAVVSALFRANFAEGRDIGERDTLLDIAERAGMDRAVTARLLDSDADADDIRARDADIRARGLQGVPAFILGRQYVLNGAQPVDTWLNILDQLAAA